LFIAKRIIAGEFFKFRQNTSSNAFMDMILYHYNTTFTLKTVYRSNMRKINGSSKEYKILVKG
jgi:hypothetical protein